MPWRGALYRWFRRDPRGLARSITLNIVLLALGFAIVLGGEFADGTIQVGLGLSMLFGFATGVALVAVANMVVELLGPPA